MPPTDEEFLTMYIFLIIEFGSDSDQVRNYVAENSNDKNCMKMVSGFNQLVGILSEALASY